MAYRRYNKFHAKKTTVGDKRFDSQKESIRYMGLCAKEARGEIRDLRTQVKFVLIPAQRGEDGRVIERECAYYADFVYYDNGQMVVEDVKGMKTPEYIIKRKLMLQIYGIRIKEI